MAGNKLDSSKLFALFTEFLQSHGLTENSANESPSAGTSSPTFDSQSKTSTSTCSSSLTMVPSPPASCSSPKLDLSPESDASTSRYTTTELLSKKLVRGRASKAQKLFSSLLKDSAIAAHIWKKAPCLEEIPDRKREAFFDRLNMLLPQLKGLENNVWKRLGQNLQNRRKYLKDKECGKRTSSKKKTAFGAISTTHSDVRRSPRLARISNSPHDRAESRGQPKSSKNMGHAQLSVARRPLFPEQSSVFDLGTKVKILSKKGDVLGTGIVMSVLSLFAELTLLTKSSHIAAIEDTELPLQAGTARCLSELNLHSKFTWRVDRLEKITGFDASSKKGKKNVQGPSAFQKFKPRTSSLLDDHETHQNETCQSEFSNNSSTKGKRKTNEQGGRAPLSKKLKSKSKAVSDFDDGNQADEQGNQHSIPEKPMVDNCNTKQLVVMEWSAGEVYLGILLEDELSPPKVISCRRPIAKILDVKGSQFKMFISDLSNKSLQLSLNPKDIQENPDMDFLVFKPKPWLYSINGKKTFSINITDTSTFKEELTSAVRHYLKE